MQDFLLSSLSSLLFPRSAYLSTRSRLREEEGVMGEGLFTFLNIVCCFASPLYSPLCFSSFFSLVFFNTRFAPFVCSLPYVTLNISYVLLSFDYSLFLTLFKLQGKKNV